MEINLLPSQSQVPFVARRLAQPRCVFVNGSIANHADWLERFAYLVPSEMDGPASFTQGSKVFLAERYGGRGTAFHGGGARCGRDGGYQIKGIGRNPLLGTGFAPGESGFWHSHGGVTLADAIAEAAWGETLHHALPFGATRVHCVIATNTQCWQPTSEGRKSTVPRGLVVREAVLRPAHFERAVYFNPAGDFPYCHDTERVRAAIRVLPQVLSLSQGSLDPIPRSREVALMTGLTELARRFAAQCATAKALRLMHGTLNASNIALDGRWLDYGTVSALPNHANTRNFGLPPHILPFWDEHENLVAVLNNLCFYISKYFPFEKADSMPQAPELVQLFRAHYELELSRSFVRLAGFPASLLESSTVQSEITQLGTLLVRVARDGVERAFVPAVADLTRYGENRLGLALLILARWHHHCACESRLATIVSNARLRESLLVAYRKIAESVYHYAALSGIRSDAFRQLCQLQAAKSAKVVAVLCRPTMTEQCRRVVHGSSTGAELATAIQRWVDGVVDQAALVFGRSDSYSSLCWIDRQKRVDYDAVQDVWKISASADTAILPRGAVENSDALGVVRTYWDERAWKQAE